METDPLLQSPDDRGAPKLKSRSRFFVLSACIVVAFLAIAGVHGKYLSLGSGLGAWLYDNPSSWIPWYGALAPVPSEATKGTARYVLHTYCKPKDAKYNYADFWLDGEKEAYLVHHNYGTNNWFTKETALKMERTVLDENTGERGYVLETDAVDFEFGFALKNTKTGEWVYEVGRGSEGLLYNAPCVQQYGSYFNRVRTSMPNPANIEYVFGSCDSTCAGYVDTANVPQHLEAQLGTGRDNALTVGKSDDARLFTLHSARLGRRFRSAVQRDTSFAESENEARFIVGNVDAYGTGTDWPSGLKKLMLATVRVFKDADNNIKIYADEYKHHTFDKSCKTTSCSAALYDLTKMWNDPTRVRVWNEAEGGTYAIFRGLYNPIFTLGSKGDSRVEFHELTFPDTAYLTTATLFEPGTWGEDIDARRLTLVSGAPCGTTDEWSATCIRNFHPVPDETVVPTKDEKIWIFSILGGENGCGKDAGYNCITMIRVKVYVDTDQSLKISTIDGGRLKPWNSGKYSELKQAGNYYDAQNVFTPHGALFKKKTWNLDPAKAYNNPKTGGMGIGGIKYVIAPEMVPSLAATNPSA